MAKSVHSWQSTSSSNFKYEPLDVTSPKPSFRLAILHPGTRESTIRVTLAHTAFADRPRYEALSYTWGSPDVVKGIEINGRRVDVRENLWSALVHLRTATQERGLWVDAICINQTDIDERNHQVNLMAHIYKRAQAVLVWLGLGLDDRAPGLGFTSSEFSITRKSLDSERCLNLIRDHAYALCDQPYWKQVWIVQEIAAATELAVLWGGVAVTWDKFSTAIKKSSPQNIDLAWKIIQQREYRHGDGFLLANLIEACQESLCEEPRDKIYGFVGIAHDCEDGSFPVDYSKSLFGLYEDVVNFQNSSAREGLQISRGNERPMTREEMEDMAYFENRAAKLSNTQNEIAVVRRKSAACLHFSQLVQNVLGGRYTMHEDFVKHHPDREAPFDPPLSTEIPENFHPFRVIGVHSGNISNIGPPYSEIIGIPDLSRRWSAELSKSNVDIKKLRKKNEGFMRVLLNFDRLDFAKIFNIDPHFSWRRAYNTPKSQVSTPRASKTGELPKFLFGPAQKLDTKSGDGLFEAESRLFLTKTGVLGLMPPGARQWDMVYQFWHSDSVAIIRKEGDFLRLVGRGVVANDYFMEKLKFQEPDEEFDGFSFDTDGEELFMDMRTLQLMTQ